MLCIEILSNQTTPVSWQIPNREEITIYYDTIYY